jgi:preprotein translocase subunit SecE
VAKKADSIMSERNDPSDLTPQAPRAERFGEGIEGQGARREHVRPGEHAGTFERMGEFFHDVRAEMRRVTWPTTDEVKNTTIITLVTMIFFAAYLFGVDQIWAFLLSQLVKLLGGA